MPSHKICIPLTGAIHCCTPSKAVNILHHACRAKATLAKWYQCFAAPAIIHAMPERLANKRFRVDFISTAELAKAFAALPLASKWSNYRENAFLIGRFLLLWKTFVRMCESVKRSSVLEYVYGFTNGILWNRGWYSVLLHCSSKFVQCHMHVKSAVILCMAIKIRICSHRLPCQRKSTHCIAP